MDVNRISGYIPGKIVFFLMQVGSWLDVRACRQAEGGGGEDEVLPVAACV
jgi:hypothetical protein